MGIPKAFSDNSAKHGWFAGKPKRFQFKKIRVKKLRGSVTMADRKKWKNDVGWANKKIKATKWF